MDSHHFHPKGWRAFRERLLLEERAEGFQTRAIDIGQEATQTGAVRKTSASKERHEG